MTAIALAALLMSADGAGIAVDRPQLEEIYQRPEFARARLRNQGTLAQLWRRLVDWFNSFFGSRGAESWAVLRLLSRRGRDHAIAPPVASSALALALEDPAAHLRRARAQLASDPRGALREGLLGLLSLLERRRFARPDRVKTNRELARELPGRGAPAELTARVERLLGGYDQTFYSLEPVATADAARFLDEVERL